MFDGAANPRCHDLAYDEWNIFLCLCVGHASGKFSNGNVKTAIFIAGDNKMIGQV